jgi:hypothetical protein
MEQRVSYYRLIKFFLAHFGDVQGFVLVALHRIKAGRANVGFAAHRSVEHDLFHGNEQGRATALADFAGHGSGSFALCLAASVFANRLVIESCLTLFLRFQ